MRILGVTQRISGVGWHRIMMPVTYMKKDYGLITDLLNEEVLEQGYDILIINRMLNNVSAEMLDEWRNKYNFKLVIDNDDYWNLDPTHVLFHRYAINDIPNKIKKYIEIADICTCTHERLADKISELNKNVYILPNALPYGEEQYKDGKIPSDKVRLYWSGSDTHLHDIKILKEPVKRFNTLNVKMVMAGYHEGEIWNTMAFYYSAGRRLDTQIYRYNDVTRYMEAAGDSDIGLVPLQDTFFNSMKSNLKVLEMAAKKNPAIVSHVNPYLNLPVHYVKKQTDWYKHVKDLVNDKQMREESGEALFNYCNTNFNLHMINKIRYDIYSKLIDARN